jgi:hypothetical protein
MKGEEMGGQAQCLQALQPAAFFSQQALPEEQQSAFFLKPKGHLPLAQLLRARVGTTRKRVASAFMMCLVLVVMTDAALTA